MTTSPRQPRSDAADGDPRAAVTPTEPTEPTEPTRDSAVSYGNPPPAPDQETPAQRRLRYLWRPPEPARTGRRASLTLADVVAAAIEIADAGGLADVSMRRVAAGLGVAPMSLYTYLPGKDELVDLMIDAAHAELRLPPADAAWDAALRTLAHEQLEMHLRHPWLLDTNPARQPLAPHVLDAEEATLRAVRQLALPARAVVEVTSLLAGFVRDHARAQLAEAAESTASGADNDSYWQEVGSFWDTYFDPERYPTMVAIWEQGGYDTGEATFDEALDRLLASLAR